MVRTRLGIRPQRCPGILAAPAARTAHFLGFIAPLHSRSNVKRNVTAAVSVGGSSHDSGQLARSDCPVPSLERGVTLLHLDSCARLGELLLDGLGFFLRDTFLNGLRSAIDQIFGFLQTQAGDLTDSLDHVNLVRAHCR